MVTLQELYSLEHSSGSTSNLDVEEVAKILKEVGHFLPAQGPISVFIHHNTLHAFENLEFFEGLQAASRIFSCKAFLSEKEYRRHLSRGRIRTEDLHQLLKQEQHECSSLEFPGYAEWSKIKELLLLYEIAQYNYAELKWYISEAEAMKKLRADIPLHSKERLLSRAYSTLGRDISESSLEKIAVEGLWNACEQKVRALYESKADKSSSSEASPLELTAEEQKRYEFIRPILIRFSASFLDQGLGAWSQPFANRQYYKSFIELYSKCSVVVDPTLRELARVCKAEIEKNRSSLELIVDFAKESIIDQKNLKLEFLKRALLVPGWAGMIFQAESRPDRLPRREVTASLSDFLAVFLLVEQVVKKTVTLEQALRVNNLDFSEEALISSDTWKLFNVSQLLGRDGSELSRLSLDSLDKLLIAIDEFRNSSMMVLLHRGYEMRYRNEYLDAISRHNMRVRSQEPEYQVICCIDEREESFRRHLEEISPECETFGYAGFFGVAMYYQSVVETSHRPLCPVNIVPEKVIKEVYCTKHRAIDNVLKKSRKIIAWARQHTAVESKTILGGSLLATFLGALAAIPLIARVIFPRLMRSIGTRSKDLLAADAPTRLCIHDHHTNTNLYSIEEMANIVEALIKTCGLQEHLSKLVFILGHGSSSLNNPHRSAYDCGACGGGAGGPNARAFAQMANYHAVRKVLKNKGMEIDSSVWFVGGEHNTCNDDIIFFDQDLIPESHIQNFEKKKSIIFSASCRNAHERCRRFDNVPSWISAERAKSHVESRSEDLAQPRPEYGHATNAACIIGRRNRSSGLFLDRRSFLISYDPTTDLAGDILVGLFQAVIPVVAGISLEYFFGRVDNLKYGCGTKLPHNITSLLGVMDGHQSDLRTGLAWQMVGIHEPMRLLVLVETTKENILKAVNSNERLQALVKNHWIQLAILSPESNTIEVFDEEFYEYIPEDRVVTEVSSSIDWYQGRKTHLPFCEVVS